MKMCVWRQLLITAVIFLCGAIYAGALQLILHSGVGYEYMLLTATCLVPGIVMAMMTDEGIQLGINRQTLWHVALLCSVIQGVTFGLTNALVTVLFRTLHIKTYGMILFAVHNSVSSSLVGGLFVGTLCGLFGVTAWHVLVRNLKWGSVVVMLFVVIAPMVIYLPTMIVSFNAAVLGPSIVVVFVVVMLVLILAAAGLNRYLFACYDVLGRTGKKA